MPDDESPIRSEVYAKLGTLTTVVTGGLVFILVFTVSMTSLMVWQAYRSGQQSEKIKAVAVDTHESLCALKSDLQRRYESGVLYFQKHPNGVPSLGLTPTDLARSLEGQKSTLDSLGRLRCKNG